MSILHSIILGLLQGLCEFLPVSSSGHLVLASKAFGLEEAGMLLAIVLHGGTLLAVFIVLWRDLWEMITHPTKPYLWLLVLASVPALIVAVLLGDTLDALFGGGFLGISFIITSALLFAQRYFPARVVHDKLNARDALTMGCFQAVALVPGISRSGATLVGGLFTGLDREKAVRFSFLMSVPAIVGSLLKELVGVLEVGMPASLPTMPLVIGVLVSAISGIFAIRLMIWIVKSARLEIFAWYTLALGIFVCLDQWVFHLIF